ncbi:MAG TPA: PilZ domain-containing protein [Candidatus Brocadiia bacterium]|nr:PilZ domain-containing protein [Planctomycetota bacterium]MDO8092413.1 PilZ domain-containing protein [Candidatus Brocadiales bacterium]
MSTRLAKDINEKRWTSANSDRRANRRLNLTLPIMLPTGKAYTKNISTGGAYLELETKNVELCHVGQNIPIYVHASYDSTTYSSQHLWLFANAVVVRKEKAGDKWGVGLMFSEKTDMMLCTVNGFY